MVWATCWALFSQAHPVTLLASTFLKRLASSSAQHKRREKAKMSFRKVSFFAPFFLPLLCSIQFRRLNEKLNFLSPYGGVAQWSSMEVKGSNPVCKT
jgi:hypothetical protein